MTELLFVRQDYEDVYYYVVKTTKRISKAKFCKIFKLLENISSDDVLLSDITLLGIGKFDSERVEETNIKDLFKLREIKEHDHEYYAKEWEEKSRKLYKTDDVATISFTGFVEYLGSKGEYVFEKLEEQTRAKEINQYISELYKLI